MKLAELCERMVCDAEGMTAKTKDQIAKAEVLALGREARKMVEDTLDENLASMKAAHQFTDRLEAKLRSEGFRKDRNHFVADKRVIEVEIDLEDEKINWAYGELRGSKPNWKESGKNGLDSESQREVMNILLTFAKAKAD